MRGELMILPSGVSKGTGVHHALGTLGISPHSAIGLGDAENDLSLLSTCELGVAVGNAVDSLRAHADLDPQSGVKKAQVKVDGKVEWEKTLECQAGPCTIPKPLC